jgi:hypothetical protein
MSYAHRWAEDIAKRLECGDYDAASEVALDDTGCSTTLEYALASAVGTLLEENRRLKQTGKTIEGADCGCGSGGECHAGPRSGHD